MAQTNHAIITQITSRIRKALPVEKVFLFGSHAWGIPDESSDFDIFIITPSSEQPPHRRATQIYRHLRGLGVPIDLIVMTHNEVEQARQVATSLTSKVLAEGKVLYE